MVAGTAIGREGLGKEQADCKSEHAGGMVRGRQARAEGKRSMSEPAGVRLTSVAYAGGRTWLISRYDTVSRVKLEARVGSLIFAWIGSLDLAHGPGTAGLAPNATVPAMPRRSRPSARGLQGVSLTSCLFRGQYIDLQRQQAGHLYGNSVEQCGSGYASSLLDQRSWSNLRWGGHSR